MTEEANTEDVKEQEAVAPVEATEETSQDKPQEPTEGSKEFNWRAMERKMGELERQNAELSKAVTQAKPQAEPESPEPQLEEDDLITVAQADKRAMRLIEQELAKREKAKLPAKTKSQFSDYDQVVTPENIERLIKEDPDLEHDISVARNPYSRAYKAIKQAQFFKDQGANKENEEKIASNSGKPVSSNTIGKQRPLSHANAYAKGSPDLMAEMQKYRGGSI